MITCHILICASDMCVSTYNYNDYVYINWMHNKNITLGTLNSFHSIPKNADNDWKITKTNTQCQSQNMSCHVMLSKPVPGDHEVEIKMINCNVKKPYNRSAGLKFCSTFDSISWNSLNSYSTFAMVILFSSAVASIRSVMFNNCK